MTRFAILVLATSHLFGCAYFKEPERGDNPSYRAVYPRAHTPDRAHQGSLFQGRQTLALYSDIKAHQVGDILTVKLSEKTTAKKSSDTNATKKSSQSTGIPKIFGNDHKPLDINYKTDGSFDGTGKSNQSNDLTGSITVTVSEVLPNNNLMIQGEKWIQLNQGQEYIRLTGIVRPEDIGDDNTILSTRIANPQIAYSSTGLLNDANTPGMFNKFFLGWKKIWPF